MPSQDDKFFVGDQAYPIHPGLSDYLTEAFLPMDQRAQVDHARKIMQQVRNLPARDTVSPWTNMQGGTDGQ